MGVNLSKSMKVKKALTVTCQTLFYLLRKSILNFQ